MRLVMRVDPDTDETLMWVGGQNFDLIQAQQQLRNAGMVIQEVREDRWAVCVSAFALKAPEASEEAPDGR